MGVGKLGATILLLLVAASSRPALADVKLPALFGDNMVLQRNMAVPVWGTANPGEAVTVTIAGQKGSTTADAAGKWTVRLSPLQAADALTLTVIGKNTVTLHNVGVGEVWVCAGQGNMAPSLQDTEGAATEGVAATYPAIRAFTVKPVAADKPRTETSGKWVACSPATAAGFYAVGYYFARELYQTLDVPIGLIQCAQSGSTAEAWTSRAALASDPTLAPIIEDWSRRVLSYHRDKAAYLRQTVLWRAERDKAWAADHLAPPRPEPPDGPDSPHRACQLYNGMIAPLTPYRIKGVVWYQGEANVGNANLYRRLFPALIANWRHDWSEGDFPFLFVQLSNHRGNTDVPGDTGWAALREAQSMALTLPNTAMVVSIDYACTDAMQRQTEVGLRLAPAALAMQYNMKLVNSGPIYDSMRLEDNKIRLHFRSTSGGLLTEGGGIGTSYITGYKLVPDDPRHRWLYQSLDWLYHHDIEPFGDPSFDTPPRAWNRYKWALGVASVNDRLPEYAKSHAFDTTTMSQLKDLVEALRREFFSELHRVRPEPEIVRITFPIPQLHGFEVAGADHQFMAAKARIEGDDVVLESDQVPQPKFARYAWGDSPAANLFNTIGLPAIPFRTETWPDGIPLHPVFDGVEAPSMVAPVLINKVPIPPPTR